MKIQKSYLLVAQSYANNMLTTCRCIRSLDLVFKITLRNCTSVRRSSRDTPSHKLRHVTMLLGKKQTGLRTAGKNVLLVLVVVLEKLSTRVM